MTRTFYFFFLHPSLLTVFLCNPARISIVKFSRSGKTLGHLGTRSNKSSHPRSVRLEFSVAVDMQRTELPERLVQFSRMERGLTRRRTSRRGTMPRYYLRILREYLT